MSHFEQLLKAARDGDKGKVISIFEALLEDYKHDLSMRTRAISETASKAAEYSHPKILKWCFSQGFTLPEESYEHPFHMAACWSQSTAVWQVLLDNDFDLNRHEVGGTPLSHRITLLSRRGAIQSCHTADIRLL